MDELYIGLMSGTSCDGIDAALVKFHAKHFTLLATLYHPYPEPLRLALLNVVQQKQIALEQYLRLDHELSAMNTLAVKRLLQEARQRPDNIRAIGYHGQTLFHAPQEDIRNTLQLGNASFLAYRSGIPVVSDLRRMDMAAGGQGAPMVPGFHRYLFASESESRAIINIGGIANLTILPATKAHPVSGFDSGPGNCLLDDWCMRHQQKAYDENGEWARQGQVIPELLQLLLSDHYFTEPCPKSTGREYFNLAWLDQYLAKSGKAATYSAVDVQATLLQLTCETLAQAVIDAKSHIEHIFICGGGAANGFLMQKLQQTLASIKVETTQAIGLAADWVEACAFAWLARQRILKQPGNIASVTGAQREVIGGGLYLP